MLVTTSFPNLVGGVSQQPSAQRLPNQCEVQENAVPLLVGGLIKRPPTNHILELKDSSAASIDLSGAFTHFVTRDSEEEFIVSLPGTTNTVYVNDLTGAAKTVYSDLGDSTYLQAGAGSTATITFSGLPTADQTIVITSTGGTATTYTAKTGETLADGEFVANGTVAATIASLQDCIEHTSGEGHNGAILVSSDGVDTLKLTQAVVGVSGDKPITNNLGANVSSSNFSGGADPDTSALKAITIADVTFLVNTNVKARMKEDVTQLSPHSRSQSATPYDGLIWVRSSSQGIAYKAVVRADSAESDTEISVVHTPAPDDLGGDGSTGDPNIYGFPPGSPSTTAIAAGLALGTAVTDCAVTASGLNGIANYTAESSGSVVFVTNTAEDFQLTVEDSLGQNGHKIIKGSVGKFADLPPIAKNGMIVLVKGDPESEVDDYYVKFEVNGDGGADFGEGLWIETIGPAIKYQWDYDTLPHIIIRQADGTFMVKRADGTTPSSNVPVGGNYASFKFIPREAGSDLTNPAPSFVDNTINDISFFKNRLAIMSGENCALSEAAELFNFFRTTTTQLLDIAPIDVGVGGTEINKIEKAIPFSDRLILFSERTQFALQGEAILSPMTASITQVTNWDVTTKVSPVSAGSSLFFPFNRGSFSGIREFYKTTETDINFDAVESTAQVPKYIPGIVEEMTVSTHEDLLAVLARSGGAATNEFYMYKYYKTEKGRVQSAWFKFILTGCEIINLHFIGQSLYLILKRGSKTFLEKMDLQTGLTDTGKAYTTHLDRRTSITAEESGFVLELPYDIESGDTMQVVSEDGEVMTIQSQTTNTITLYEEFAASDMFYVGIPYTMKYQLSKPVLKRQKPDGGYEIIAVGRHQIRYMTVVYSDTAYFSVRITPEVGGSDGTPIDYPYSGRFLSTGGFLGQVVSDSGDFRFPVFSQSDAVKIEILNDSPLPSNIQSIEFEANFVSRSQPRFA